MIKVRKPGLQTTVQDQGRIGYYEIGMPPSGAFDQNSYAIANALVGNEAGAAALEITYMGPELEFLSDACMAITGANMPPRVNGSLVPMWETTIVRSGDVLSFDYLKEGARVYIAVAGGIQVPQVLGSRSTYILSGVGGLQGRALQVGDLLEAGDLHRRKVRVGLSLQPDMIPRFSNSYKIRIVDGLCSYRLTQDSKQTLVETEWVITPEANRVGYRIKGGALHFIERTQPFGAGSSPSNVVEVGYPVGSIQVPVGTEPIILLKDAVTSGGYATVATVISTDLNLMAQAKTNDKIKFRYVSIDESLQARRRNTETLQMVMKFILERSESI